MGRRILPTLLDSIAFRLVGDPGAAMPWHGISALHSEDVSLCKATGPTGASAGPIAGGTHPRFRIGLESLGDGVGQLKRTPRHVSAPERSR